MTSRPASREQPEKDWRTVLRRQPTRIAEDRPDGYTDMWELICGDCGDDPELDYREVSLRLQLIRGPYPIAIGVVAYEKHIKSHQRLAEALPAGVEVGMDDSQFHAEWLGQ